MFDKYNKQSNINNGLMTKIWGPPAWKFLHSVTFGYPIKPTVEKKEKYRQFFTSVGDILPCGACRDSYIKFINEDGTKLTDKVMDNRESLSKWLYKIHNKVNKKLKYEYGITYDNVQNVYESYRAGNSNTKQSTCNNKWKIYRLVL